MAESLTLCTIMFIGAYSSINQVLRLDIENIKEGKIQDKKEGKKRAARRDELYHLNHLINYISN